MADAVFVQTSLGGYVFDATFRVAHSTKVTFTEHPVEEGAAVSDHSYVNPAAVVLEIGMSDVATSITSDQFGTGAGRSVNAYNVLTELQSQRIPLQLVTRLKTYTNMGIESIDTPDNAETMFGLKATITLKQILVATVKTVKISARTMVTDSTNKGSAEPVDPDKTLLQSIADVLGIDLASINNSLKSSNSTTSGSTSTATAEV